MVFRSQAWGDIWVRAGWRAQSHPAGATWRVVDPANSVIMSGSLSDCMTLAGARAPAWHSPHCVVFLHALAGLPRWMDHLAASLRLHWQLAQIACPTVFEDIEASGARLRGILAVMASDGITSVSIIGHSYGGLLARALSGCDLPMRIDRIVMLGTPNQGSRLAAILVRFPLYGWIFGAAGRNVLADCATALPIPQVPTLSIAGELGRFGLNPLLPGNDDGVVTVAETRLAGANIRLLTVTALHRFIPRNGTAIAAITRFLKETS